MRELIALILIIIGFIIFSYITELKPIEEKEKRIEIIRDSLLYEKYQIEKQ